MFVFFFNISGVMRGSGWECGIFLLVNVLVVGSGWCFGLDVD